MGKVILGLSMSLDGFINDANGDVGSLYSDLEALRDTEVLKSSIRTTGAVVMGRRSFHEASARTEIKFRVVKEKSA